MFQENAAHVCTTFTPLYYTQRRTHRMYINSYVGTKINLLFQHIRANLVEATMVVRVVLGNQCLYPGKI